MVAINWSKVLSKNSASPKNQSNFLPLHGLVYLSIVYTAGIYQPFRSGGVWCVWPPKGVPIDGEREEGVSGEEDEVQCIPVRTSGSKRMERSS